MGEAKRKKAAGYVPVSLSKSLVAAWKNDIEVLLELFEKTMKQSKPDKVIEEANKLLKDDDLFDFTADIFDIAGSLFPTLMYDGKLTNGRLSVFTIAVYGSEEDMETMLESDVLDAVTRQFRQSGYAHNESNIILSPVLLDPVSAVWVSPVDIRYVANELLLCALRQEGNAKYIEKLVLDSDLDLPHNSVHIVTRLLVGARLIIESDEETIDFFDPPPYLHDNDDNDEDNQNIYEEHNASRLEAREKFYDSCNQILESKNINLILDGPHEWTTGIGAMAMLRLKANLALHAETCGVSIDNTDEVHVTTDEAAIHIAVNVHGNFIGPVDIPLPLANYCMDEIDDWIENFTHVIRHPNLEALNANRSMTRH